MIATIATWIGKLIVTVGVDKLIGLLHAFIEQHKADEAAKKKAADSMNPLNDAKTGEEVDEASDDALNGL